MSLAPADKGGRPGGKLFERLHALTSSCARLPMVAGFALVVSARIVPLFGPPSDTPVVPEAAIAERVSPDAAVIDTVLAKRAPDLGLTLRRQLGRAIAEEARRSAYDPLLILAIIDVESDFEQEAVSVMGARGLMQIQPATLHFLADQEGLRLSHEELAKDPPLCVRLGIRYLRWLQDHMGGDLDLALMAYNAGPTRIWQAYKENDLEPFRPYPRAVRRDFRRLREGEGLGGDWALAQRASVSKDEEE